MNESPIELLHARMDRWDAANAGLENENRALSREAFWLRRLALGVVVVGIVLAVGGAKLADRPKVIEAQCFVLRDSNGKERGAFRVLPDARVELYAVDEDQKQIFDVVLTKDVIKAYMGSNESKEMVSLELDSHSTSPMLTLSKDGYEPIMIAPREKVDPAKPPVPPPPVPPLPPPSPPAEP